MRDVNALIEETKAEGVWVFNGGLHPPSTATVVRLEDGEVLMTDGPFAESKEHIGGFLVIKAPDLDSALEWARKIARALITLPIEVPAVPGGVRPITDSLIAGVPTLDTSEIERVFREEYGRAVAVLVRQFGDIDRRRGGRSGCVHRGGASDGRPPDCPPSPAGWIITTARNRAIDRLRREASREDRHAQARCSTRAASARGRRRGRRARRSTAPDLHLLPSRARHRRAGRPDAAAPRRPHDARRSRARSWCPSRRWRSGWCGRRARSAMRGFRIGSRATRDLPGRLRAVLAVVYLIFNEGYAASSGDRLVREDLCAEAIRLGRLLAGLMPDEPEVIGLLALMLLIESRRAARTTPDGDLVLLADQDRELWDRDLIAEGQAIVRRCLARNQPGPYQIQAAINAVHSDAAVASATDWRQILQLYDQLLSMAPGPVVALNRAVAVAEVDGPEAALALVDALSDGGLEDYHLFHAIRADLLRRLGRTDEAALAYAAAIARAGNARERDFLERSRQALTRA